MAGILCNIAITELSLNACTSYATLPTRVIFMSGYTEGCSKLGLTHKRPRNWLFPQSVTLNH